MDGHQELYRRYFGLKDRGLSHSEISDRLLEESLQRSVDDPGTKFNADYAANARSAVAGAYENVASLDAMDRDTFYDIKNGLIPYDPQTQFPNAYKIWLGKFDGTKD